MKYRKLPLEQELQALAQTNAADMQTLRTGLFLETARTRGFQLVTLLLRELETIAMGQLRCGSAVRPDRQLGRLEVIEEIRRSLTALLPDGEQQRVDWHDDELEDYVNLDVDRPAPQ